MLLVCWHVVVNVQKRRPLQNLQRMHDGRTGNRLERRRSLMVLHQSGAKVTITLPQKITFGEMRASSVTGVLVYCQNFSVQPLDARIAYCGHWTTEECQGLRLV